MRKYQNGKKIAYGGTVRSYKRSADGRRQTYARIRRPELMKNVKRVSGLWPDYGGSLKINFTDTDEDGFLDTIRPKRRIRSLKQINLVPINQWVEWGTGTVQYINLTNNWNTYR